MKFCDQRGAELDDNSKFCNECGHKLPIDSTETDQKVEGEIEGEIEQDERACKKYTSLLKKLNYYSNKKHFRIVIVGLVVVIIIGGAIFYKNREEEKYLANIRGLESSMDMCKEDADIVCVITQRVWYNTLYEKSEDLTDEYTKDNDGDFNSDYKDSITRLYSSSYIQLKVADIEDSQDEVKEMMNEIQKSSDKNEKYYEAASNLYGQYKFITNLALYPEGSYKSYTGNYNEHTQDYEMATEKLDTILSE